MPTLITHLAPPLSLRLGLGGNAISGRLLGAGLLASILPDLDVLAFKFGIPYAHALGHRGLSHSLLFASLVGLLALIGARWLQASRTGAFTFIGLSAVSHPLLDMLTNGGLGVALYWPWSKIRHFAPWQPIDVSPLSLSRFLGPRGIAVLGSELLWVWLPAALFGLALFVLRRYGPHLLPQSEAGRRQAGLALFIGSLLWFCACFAMGGGDGHEYLMLRVWEANGFVLPILFALAAFGIKPPAAARPGRFALFFSVLALLGLLLAWLGSTAIVAGIGQLNMNMLYEGGLSLNQKTLFLLLALGIAFTALTHALHRYATLTRFGILATHATLSLALTMTLLGSGYLLIYGRFIHWRP